MGRTQPSRGLAPPPVRKDARAKHAKATINKIIPALLASNARARKGVESAELIVDPPPPKSPSPTPARGSEAAARKQQGQGPAAEEHESAPLRQLTLKLMCTDFITAAECFNHQLRRNLPTKRPRDCSKRPRIGILNPASLLRPGGGFLSGAQAGEEFLCLRTTLLPSLREEFYRLPEVGGVLTRDVLVFRDGAGRDLAKSDRYHVDVVSAGMLRTPEVERMEELVVGNTPAADCQNQQGREELEEVEGGSEGTGEEEVKQDEEEEENDDHSEEVGNEGNAAPSKNYRTRYAHPSERALVHRKMRSALRIFQSAGCTHIVLCAWGCGAYGNPVEEVAQAWKSVLLGSTSRGNSSKGRKAFPVEENWESIEEVIFAVKEPKVARQFARWFGNGLEILESPIGDKRGGNADVPAGDGDKRLYSEVEELTAKIQEMEGQYEQIRNPDLKARVGEAIEGLKRSRDGAVEGTA